MLNRIKATNFMSWKSLEFNLTTGITLIDGWNEDDQTSEGSGKSAILNALAWALFGKLPKDTNTDDVIKYDATNCEVSVDFDDGTTIVRSRKPNDLYIEKRGKRVKGKDARETQQQIQDYIGLSFESFCQSAYFAQNYNKKFLLSNQEEKGKILSDIQDISIFDKAKKEVQELSKLENQKLFSLKNQLNVEDGNLSGTKSQITLVESFIVNKQKQHQEYFADLTKKRDAHKNSIDQSEARKMEILAKLETLNPEVSKSSEFSLNADKTKVQQELSDVTYKRTQLGNAKRHFLLKEQEGRNYASKYEALAKKKTSVEEYLKNPTKNCPTCGNELAVGSDVSHVEKELDQLNEEMSSILVSLQNISEYLDSNKVESDQELFQKELELKQSILNIDKEIKKCQHVQQEHQAYTNMLSNQAREIASSVTFLEDIEKSLLRHAHLDLAEESEKLLLLSQKSDQVQERIGQLKLIEEETSKYIFELDTLKDGFKEIKSYVFNTALNELSHRANEFLSTLFEVTAKIEFVNEDLKIETKVYLGDRETSIGLLSGGQFRRFSLAIDLALSDMVSSRKNSKLNVLILDEYFKDLSETSMEKCLDLLKLRKCPVLLIEHNSIFKNIVDNVFFVRLEEGTSYATQNL